MIGRPKFAVMICYRSHLHDFMFVCYGWRKIEGSLQMLLQFLNHLINGYSVILTFNLYGIYHNCSQDICYVCIAISTVTYYEKLLVF